MINLNKISRKLLLLQRNELLSTRQKYLRKKFGRYIFTNILVHYFQKNNLESLTEDLFKRELNTFEKYLPATIENIIDIGCGLGILHIYINRMYQNKPSFYLLDKNTIDSKIKYGFSKNYESYNVLNETKNILLNNGVMREQIHLKNVDEEFTIFNKIDLVISLKSMGYHYPIENYIGLLQKICNYETIFVFDVAGEKYDIDTLKLKFKEVQIIYEENTMHTLKRVCCSGLYPKNS